MDVQRDAGGLSFDLYCITNCNTIQIEVNMPKGKQNISLRLDPELAYELAFLRKSLNLDLSKTIKEAIHSKYLQIKEDQGGKTPADILAEVGFVGAFEASPDSSVEYKQVYLKSLRNKHGQ